MFVHAQLPRIPTELLLYTPCCLPSRTRASPRRVVFADAGASRIPRSPSVVSSASDGVFQRLMFHDMADVFDASSCLSHQAYHGINSIAVDATIYMYVRDS